MLNQQSNSVFRTIKFTFVICFFVLADDFARAQDNTAVSGESVIAVAEQWDSFTHPDGTGWFWQLLREMYEPEGIALDYRILPWARAVTSVRRGQADVLVAEWINAEGPYIFSKHPIGVETIWCLTRKELSTPCTELINQEDSIISWVRGMEFDVDFLDPKGQVVKVLDTASGVNLVKAERVQGYVGYPGSINQNLDDLEKYNLEILHITYSYLAFHESERGKRLAAIADRRFIELYQSGWYGKNVEDDTHRKALEQYFENLESPD